MSGFNPGLHPRGVHGRFAPVQGPRKKGTRLGQAHGSVPVGDLHTGLAAILARGAKHNPKFAKVAQRAATEAGIRKTRTAATAKRLGI